MEPNKDSSYPEYYPQKEFLNNLQFPGPQQIPNFPPLYYDPSQANPNSNFQNIEKAKRHRRGKSEINERNYHCPDCDKCYLSGPALTTHRKTKHGYGINGEKRARGRPRKECINENNISPNPQNKFLFFFGEEHRKIINEQEIVDLETIKQNIKTIFKQCKESIFNEVEDVEKYDFYNLIVDNWEKDEPEFEQECFSSIAFNMNLALKDNNENINIKVQSCNTDWVFFFYLKEFYKLVNKVYFWFILKFVILFREFLNQSKKNFVKNGDNKVFTQLYNAEIIPEMFNEFLLDFMEAYDYFGLNKNELIELIQHFCYWLNVKRYSQTQLSLINN